MSTYLDQNRRILPFTTWFEDANRFSVSSGNATLNWAGLGVEMNAGSVVIPGYAKVVGYAENSNFKSFKGQPMWIGNVSIKTANKNHTYYWGFGEIAVTAAGGHVYTDDHIGWKALIDGAGIITLYATQASGGAEGAISMGTIAANDVLDLYVEVDRLGVNYYFRKNAGEKSDIVRIESRMPTADNQSIVQVSVSTNGQTTVADFIASFAGYGR